MKILFVLEDLMIGGAQRHAAMLAQGLAAAGMDCRVLILGDQVAPALDVEVGGAVRLGQRGLMRPAEWTRLARAVAAEAADVVVAVNQVSACVVAAAVVSQRLKAATVCIFHTTRVASAAGWVRTAPFLAAVRLLDALVFVSPAQRDFWRSRGLAGLRTVVAPNGVDLARFTPVSASERLAARAALGIDPRAIVFGTIAAFRREKNHVQLVAAIGALVDEGRPAGLLLVGDGPTRVRVAAAVAARGLCDRAVFAGEQADVRPWLAAMDVAVLASTSVETAPLFVLESMARGVAVVAPDLGGVPDLVEHGRTGLLFPPGDIAALVDRLRIAADPDRRLQLGQAAVRARERFDAQHMIARYARLFRDLAGARA